MACMDSFLAGYVGPDDTCFNYMRNITCRYWSVELERKKRGQVPRLWFAWFKCFWMRIFLQGIVMFSIVGLMQYL